VHEIKHDGYRLIVRRDGGRVSLFTRRGHDWSGRYPLIIDAARRLKVSSIVIDGEAVILGPDGRSDFDKLHTHGYDNQVVLYAFALIRVDGEDWRPRPLEERKAKLAKILTNAQHGIYVSEHLDDDGELIFKHACRMGLEGIVSKRRDFPCRSDPTKSSVKVKRQAQRC
jgi:ATP-dependent DNA ligase